MCDCVSDGVFGKRGGLTRSVCRTRWRKSAARFGCPRAGLPKKGQGNSQTGWFHFGSLLKPSNKVALKKGHCQDLGASCVFGSLRMGHLSVFKGEVHLGRMYETHSNCKGTAQTAHFAFLFVGGFTPRDLQYWRLSFG